MTKYLLLSSVLLFILAGSVASAEPAATNPPLFVIEQTEPASPLCPAESPDVLFEIKPRQAVSICQGNPCDKTADCRPAGVAECAQCYCIGPAGDKHCGCI